MWLTFITYLVFMENALFLYQMMQNLFLDLLYSIYFSCEMNSFNWISKIILSQIKSLVLQ